MLYVDTDKCLHADEVLVAPASDVYNMVKEGWRILAIVGTTTPASDHNSAVLKWHADDSISSRNFKGSIDTHAPVVFVPMFIMGRDDKEADRVSRIKELEDNLAVVASAAAEERKARDGLISDLAACNERNANLTVVRDNYKKVEDALQDRIEDIARDVNKVRAEIGEARWREILHALEIEDVLHKESQ